jgi:hypothetical protein
VIPITSPACGALERWPQAKDRQLLGDPSREGPKGRTARAARQVGASLRTQPPAGARFANPPPPQAGEVSPTRALTPSEAERGWRSKARSAALCFDRLSMRRTGSGGRRWAPHAQAALTLSLPKGEGAPSPSVALRLGNYDCRFGLRQSRVEFREDAGCTPVVARADDVERLLRAGNGYIQLVWGTPNPSPRARLMAGGA